MSYLFAPCPDGWDEEGGTAAPLAHDILHDMDVDSGSGLVYFALELAAGHQESLNAWPHGTIESIAVIKGRISVFDGCETWSLGPGDRLLCHPGMSHHYHNTGTDLSVICLIIRD